MKEHTAGRVLWIIMASLAGMLSLPGQMTAGNLEPAAAPGPTMKTLDEIPPTWSQKLLANDRFVLVLDDTAVLDKETGLVWEKSPDATNRTWHEACVHCYTREVGGRKGWRLPAIEELSSLVDASESNPALPEGHPFSNVESSTYWSSTTDASITGDAWFLWFSSGASSYGIKGSATNAWCVRGGHGHDGY